MKSVALLDTSVCSVNTADNYLTETCHRIISDILPYHHLIKVSTHNPMDELTKSRLNNCETGIICGSGILSSTGPDYETKNQWRWYKYHINYKLNGCGIGFESMPKLTTEAIEIYYHVFSKSLLSVRGEYSRKALSDIGLNVINTGCPTLWNPFEFTASKSENVIFSINVYRGFNIEAFYKILKNHYKKVYFFCQHPNDYEIFKNVLGDQEQYFAPCGLQQLAEFAKLNNCDYVGARVHAAAYLVNQGIRSIVINVDIRSEEVWKEARLPIVYTPSELDMFCGMDLYFKNIVKQKEINIWKEAIRHENC